MGLDQHEANTCTAGGRAGGRRWCVRWARERACVVGWEEMAVCVWVGEGGGGYRGVVSGSSPYHAGMNTFITQSRASTDGSPTRASASVVWPQRHTGPSHSPGHGRCSHSHSRVCSGLRGQYAGSCGGPRARRAWDRPSAVKRIACGIPFAATARLAWWTAGVGSRQQARVGGAAPIETNMHKRLVSAGGCEGCSETPARDGQSSWLQLMNSRPTARKSASAGTSCRAMNRATCRSPIGIDIRILIFE
jgi:hypothetical protein